MTYPTSEPTDEDRTFHDVSMYGSVDWAALTMGVSKDVFFRHRAKWARELGFPKPDPVNRLYIKRDVEAWVMLRRTVPDEVSGVTIGASDDSPTVNFDGL